MKMLIYGSVFIFSTIGAYIPSLWHAGIFSVWGIVWRYCRYDRWHMGGYQVPRLRQHLIKSDITID